MKKSVAVSSTITAEQDAPPTDLVLYGSRYNPIVVHLSRITDGGNKALGKAGEILAIWSASGNCKADSVLGRFMKPL